jgi:carboxyl-terminal processing protease
MVRRTVAGLLVLLLLAAATTAGARADESTSPEKELADREEVYELQKLLVDTLDRVERNYVRDVSRRELVEAAIRGIVEELDPYSSYISRDEMNQFRTSVESEFGGIGIQIELDEGQLKVLSPLVGTPAYRAGIVAGDRIVEIGGQSTSGITLDEAVSRLKGESGTTVTLTIIHPGRSTKDQIVITREVVRIDTVLGDRRKADDAWDFMLDADKRIGCVRVSAFSRNTAAELREALDRLKKEDVAGLILDLRFNPGGLLSSAIEVSDLFVSSGRIVSVEGRNSPERNWDAHRKGTYEGFPMVVLVNRFSASASEIVAACLQDHHRAAIIGERTWGKGSVQNVIPMEENQSALKLTTASYHRPSGKNIHRFPKATDNEDWGVMPDEGYTLRLTDREVISLMEDRRRRDVVRHDPGDEKTGQAEPPAEDTADGQGGSGEAAGDDSEATAGPAADQKKVEFVDPHVRMALDYLTGELARAETAAPAGKKE